MYFFFWVFKFKPATHWTNSLKFESEIENLDLEKSNCWFIRLAFVFHIYFFIDGKIQLFALCLFQIISITNPLLSTDGKEWNEIPKWSIFSPSFVLSLFIVAVKCKQNGNRQQ